LIKELAKSTGVHEGDVAKVLEHLGLSRILPEATKVHGGEPPLSTAKLGFKIGKSTIVV
jgi:hypothetical protein